MKDDTNNPLYMERLEKLLSHPETISQEELEEWLTDPLFMSFYQDAMCIRRATLHAGTTPDVQQAFSAFRKEHIAPGLNEAMKKREPRIRIVTKWTAVAAAILLPILIAILLLPLSKGGQGQEMVYKVNGDINDVTLSIGNECIQLGAEDADKAIGNHGLTMNTAQSLTYKVDAPQEEKAEETLMLTTPAGKTFQVDLPDGTHVWINAESSLKYPSRFHGDTRTVELTGEACFRVTHDAAHPFIVKTDRMATTVLGTEFNVRNYAGDDPHVTLVNGKVKVSHHQQQLTLEPGEDATLNGNGRISASEVNVQTMICWREGMFYFDNMSFRSVMTELGRWYRMDVVFKHPQHLNDILHFHAERSWSIEEVIEEMNLISDAKIHKEGNTLIVE